MKTSKKEKINSLKYSANVSERFPDMYVLLKILQTGKMHSSHFTEKIFD
jgi:hypothetical protein